MRRALALTLLLLATRARAQESGVATNGMPGAIRVVSASPASGSSIAASTEWFSQPGFIFPGRNHRRSAYTLGAAWSAKHVSIGATVLAATNHDSATDPVFIYAAGDVDLGARLTADLIRRDSFAISAGIRGGVRLLQGAPPGTKVGDSASPYGRGLLTVEASRARLSLDAGYLQDNSAELLDPTQVIDAGQAYAWGISDYDAIVGGAALEVALGPVTPVLEVSGRHDLDAPGDPAVVATGGLRVRAGERLSVFAMGDYGLMGTELHPGRLRAPEWNVGGGLTLTFGERARRPAAPRIPAIGGRLRGRVIDVETSQPIAGVELELEGRTVVSSPDGSFDFGEVRTGAIRIKTRHDRYAPVEAPAYVTEKQATALRLELRPMPSSPVAGSVVGTVFDARGAPLAGARVAIAAGGAERATVTGAGGRYRVEAPAGSFAVTANAPGHAARTEMGTIAAGGSVEVNVRLLPETGAAVVPVAAGTGTLSGRVSGAKGVIAKASVTAIAADGTTKTTKTDAKGKFSLELPAGDWQVAVAAIGYPTQTQRCRVDATKPLSLEFILIKPMKPRGASKSKKSKKR